MVPSADGVVPKEGYADMIRPGAFRPDATWQVSLSTLPPHQMLVLILSKDATTKFAAWSRLGATIPSNFEREGGDIEKLRYYRMVLPMEPDRPAISSQPLTWTTISHVVWDGYSPDVLSVAQQRAMLDWLHWGGQLILSGGAGQSFALYQESFLGPYLPGEATGQTVPLSQEDLKPLSQSYRPPRYYSSVEDQSQPVPPPNVAAFAAAVQNSRVKGQSQPVPPRLEEASRRSARGYQAAAPIRPAPKHPVYLSVLRPKPGSSTIPLGEASPHVLAVESRVGRGRITQLALDPNEQALLAWPGLDTLVRRVILRRPEELILSPNPSYGIPGGLARPLARPGSLVVPNHEPRHEPASGRGIWETS